MIAKLANEDAGIKPETFVGKTPEERQAIWSGTSEGSRNTTATQYAGELLHDLKDLNQRTKERVRHQMMLWNSQNKPPLDDEELTSVLGSIWNSEVESREKEAKGGVQCVVPPGSTEKDLLGTRTPETGQWIFSKNKTLPTAVAFINEFHQHDDGRTIHCYGGQFMEWKGNRFAPVEDETLKGKIHSWLHNAKQTSVTKKGIALVDFDSNPTTVKAALDTIRSTVNLPVEGNPLPTWLGLNRDSRVPVNELLICKSSAIHLPTMDRISPTPALFTPTALEFDFEPDAPSPQRWQQFLGELFGDDLQAIEALQDWFGYCLTCDTSQQKMLLVWGAIRSGKGTVLKVLKKLVGKSNFFGSTVASLTKNFGLQELVGKSLIGVSDARLGANTTEALVAISEKLNALRRAALAGLVG